MECFIKISQEHFIRVLRQRLSRRRGVLWMGKRERAKLEMGREFPGNRFSFPVGMLFDPRYLEYWGYALWVPDILNVEETFLLICSWSQHLHGEPDTLHVLVYSFTKFVNYSEHPYFQKYSSFWCPFSYRCHHIYLAVNKCLIKFLQ